MAQLVEQSLQTPEIHGSNPVLKNFYLLYWKGEREEKEAGNVPIFIKDGGFKSLSRNFKIWDSKFSVTRFGKISPVLAKFRQFWQNVKIIWQLFEDLISIWQNFEHIVEIKCAFGPMYMAVNGQILSKYSRHLVTLIRINKEPTRYLRFC